MKTGTRTQVPVPMTIPDAEKSADSRSPSALECVTKALGLCPLATEGTQEPSLCNSSPELRA